MTGSILGHVEDIYYIKHIAQILTVIVSGIGIFLSAKHWFFYRMSTEKLSKKIRRVFFTDSLIYIITLIMGLGLILSNDMLVHYDIIARPVVLFLNVLASFSLYTHYRKMK